MSHVNTQSHPVSSRAEKGFGALPVWTSIAVILAALVTGLIISTITTSVGLPFLICFFLGALAATALVHVRGLFLTVASMPLLFAIAIFFTSWLVSRATASDGSPAFSTTILVTSAYPLLEVFPFLAVTLLICIAIAAFRLYHATHNATSINSKEQVTRRAMAESERRNRETTTRARKTTQRLSVADLVERNKKNSHAPRPDTRRGSASGHPDSGSARPSSASVADPKAASARTSSTRRGTTSAARRVPRTDEARLTRRRGAQRSGTASAHGEFDRGSSTGSRSARRVTDAQQSQERARRTQSFEARHATDNSVNAAGSAGNSRLRPDPLRRAGDIRKPVRAPEPSTPAESAQPSPKVSQDAPQQAPKEQPDTRKRAPRALDEDLYGN